MRRWGLASLLSVLALSCSPAVDAQCAQPRVRRAWTTLSADERQLYKDALAAAMDSGAYIKFVEIHTEMMSEMEAHRQCMFIYWHRLFLAAFENMLRGQGARFACVTVPYWDWMTDYSSFFTNQCSSILSCSPTLQILGDRAPTTKGKRAVAINGVSISGFCEADYPMNHFCQSSQVAGDKCADCVPRDDWLRASFPASASFASVRAQLFQARTIGEMSTAIEQGVHNNIHAELDGAMATFQSPADPVFWSHHAMVDLLHSVFHKCKVGEQPLTLAQKAASVDWSSCERRNGGVFRPIDYVVMRSGFRGTNPINTTRDPLVGPFFSVLPQQFAALSDIRDLGASSYSFELQGLAGTLFTQCGATSPAPTTSVPPTAPPTAAPTEAPTAAPTPTPTTAPPTEAPTGAPTAPPTEVPTEAPVPTPTATTTPTPIDTRLTDTRPTAPPVADSALPLPIETPTPAPTEVDDAAGESTPTPTPTEAVNDTTAPLPTATPASALLPETPTHADDDGSLDEPATPTPTRPPTRVLRPKPTAPRVSAPPTLGSMINGTMDQATSEFGHWTNAVDRLTRREGGDPLAQAEEMTCLYQDECLGGVTSYSPAFKRLFGVEEEPRCRQIVDKLRRRLSRATLAEWKAQITRTFGRPRPKQVHRNRH